MDRKIIGWVGFKEVTLASIIDKTKIELTNDIELYSILLRAINYFSQEIIKCNLESITYFNNIKSEKKGITFRMNNYQNKYLSTTIEQVKHYNQDFIDYGNKQPIELIETFYKENKETLDQKILVTNELEKSIKEGKFKQEYERIKKEKRQNKNKYKTTLLMIYGMHNTINGNQKPFLDPKGYDLREYEIQNKKSEIRDLVMNIEYLNKEINKEKKENSLIFFAMEKNEEIKYLIAQYSQKSHYKKNDEDHIGVLIKVRKTKKGNPLTKTIKTIIESLPEELESYIHLHE